MNRQTVLTPDERTWLEAQRVDLMADYAQANIYADALHAYADADEVPAWWQPLARWRRCRAVAHAQRHFIIRRDMATLRAATMHAWMTAYQILNGNDRGPIAR
jgi:hypothetical protein